MKPVFLDTSGLIALVNTDDQWHSQAESVWSELIKQSAPFVTTSLVLVEIGDGLSRIHQRQLAGSLYEQLHRSPRIEVVQVTLDIETAAWNLYRQRNDKEWGLTDCASFALMEREKITDAFSSDHHFEQAGFVRLLK